MASLSDVASAIVTLNLIDALQDTLTNPDSHQASNAPTVPGVPDARLLSGLR